MTKRLEALGLLAVAPALAVLTPHPCAPSSDPLAPLVTAVALAAWACTGLLLVALALDLLAHAPGALGRTAGQLARRVTPAPLRVLVRTAVGVGVAGAVLVGPSAVAAERVPGPAVNASLDWPGARPAAPASRPIAPSSSPTAPASSAAAPAPASPPPGTASPDPSPAPVVVRPGDSLWAIAARELGGEATDRQVAQAWPQWWSANRAVVGEDPDLIHPGTPLQHPAP